MSLLSLKNALQDVRNRTSTANLKTTCKELQESLASNRIKVKDVVRALAKYLTNVLDAEIFKRYLSNILLAIVATKIPLEPVFSHPTLEECSEAEKTRHVKNSIILSCLSDHPDIKQYTLNYFEINNVSPFDAFLSREMGYKVEQKKLKLAEDHDSTSYYQMAECCFCLLRRLPNELANKWDWSGFVSTFSRNSHLDTKWMVKECMIIIANMTEIQGRKLGENLRLQPKEVRADDKRPVKVHNTAEIVKDKDLSKAVVNIDGILLPLYLNGKVLKGNLVPVTSTVNNLRSLALAVASGKALSLLGPVGSGKTSLVEHLAAITGRKGTAFKKVQLGDQTDARMLLGSHQCTEIPGEFIWRAGVLTQAVQNGHWLLLEDIDCATLDVASTLSSLLERNTLCVPGYCDSLPVTPGFQLFVTQRTITTNYGFQKKMSNSSTLLQKHLTQINVEPLSRSELSEVIQKVYPQLSTIVPRIMEVFMMFSVGSHDTSLQATETAVEKVNIMRGSRLISTRDLMKWCSRSVQGFDVSSPESALKVLQDALDIFTCSASSPEDRLELSKKVGTCLGIVDTKSEFYCRHYKPNVALTAAHLEVGRARVPRVEKSLESIDFDNREVVFSFTRQSACLLERIACCVMSNEPVLLVGETGTGKTSSVQYLARQTGHKLIVINMNQQSDSADLLGGYKPVNMKYVIRPIKDHYEKLFKDLFNVERNAKFLGHIETCYETEKWSDLVILMKKSVKAGIMRLNKENEDIKEWSVLERKLEKLDKQVKAASRLTFAFIEGSLVKAMQEGHWVLLDEINLASAEILECLAGLLEDKNESIDLLEKGDRVPIKRHPGFTLFACMNPATDVGKKDLPVGLRNRFTEFFIDELTERNDLIQLIGDYLYHMNLSGATLEAMYSFYATIRKEAKLSLVDGSGNTPHYSLRTLCRALTAAAKAKCGTVARSLYEAFCLSFLTQLDSSSHPVVEAMIAKAVIGKRNIKSVLNQLIPEPQSTNQNYLLFEGHWIPQGQLEIDIPEGYILTQTVRKNLRDISRIISLGRLPVLLQGDTSVGKTSLITYIAKTSGNYCVRINNHEHTDLQEYIGSYATDASGRLVFKEGVLVEAMRKGYWIILDELNLAPSDVLEALNRVLDDNRELFIPETQEVIRAHPNFMLFATQNPPGLYGGRKMLSRAFRNRFVELHFDEIPKNELETILHQRCHVPPAYSKKMINVMADLQIRRRGSAAVQGKDGFITLRDLFRWGQRYKYVSKESLTDDKFYDWDQHIADEGYLVLAGKVRKTDERSIIEEVILKNIKRTVNPDNLFSLHQATSPVTKHILETILNNQLEEFSHVVWTYNMRRLAVLIAKAFTFNEPVLLVGETGCGKTTICQVLAALKKRQLMSVNCHMHTESSDFLGGLRPVRHYNDDGRLFEWVDGPLIKAMESGDMFLADEISLADDSVLERLNSLLEPERQLVLAERGMEDNSDIVVITAQSNFHFIGTMNPGGDFGKKELSPALRNRFTEIWCDSVTSRDDLLKVLEKSVSHGISLGNQEDGSSGIGSSILDFTDWLKNSEVTNKFPFSIRDLLSWVQFINAAVSKGLLETPEAYVHGACMTFLDCFGTALTGHIDSHTLVVLRTTAINFLLNQIKMHGNDYSDKLREMLSNKQTTFTAESDETKFGIKPFYIEVGHNSDISKEERFTFTAPTTGANTLRLLRGLQLNKPILLEGNPGVGKTSLVTALAKSSGHGVVRINLSDQTDITDLFGTDLPTEDGTFAFKQGAFLNALQNGDWILLDELNLAPQPVLEGLNACLDHRGEVFIPELGQTFKVKEQTKLFACQNPLKQGGARRGLPISFLNRFTQVYIDTLTKDDLIYIVESQYTNIPKDILHRIVRFNCKIAHEIIELQSWAHKGSPWEMNLRDIQRWCEALIQDQNDDIELSPGKFVDMLYVNRMRTDTDKERMIKTYDEIFLPEYPRSDSTPQFLLSDLEVSIGDVKIQRNAEKTLKKQRSHEINLMLLRNQMPSLKAIAQCTKMNWLTILVGPTATGKSSIVQVLADLTGNDLQVVPVTSAMDVSDLLGGFEQVDYNRTLENLFEKINMLTMQTVRNTWLKTEPQEWSSCKLLTKLFESKWLQPVGNDMILFNEKIEFLLNHCKLVASRNEPLSDIRIKLEGITTDITHLKARASKATSVNAGGKFEWVDSLLVKTLVEGSWLLLDNVNLTSAAVLDRLNALLEPNGVLSIPERGDISDIRPHPNFRVFFTMDPKYGEISRAMRNRGVEIFLLRDDCATTLSETMTSFDLRALIASCGLVCEYHELCISCHELMASYVQGLEKPSLNQLLQACHLIWQQLLRGIPVTTALINSFSDVYIKPRTGSDFVSDVTTSLAEHKINMLKMLQENLRIITIPEIKESAHTLTIKGLCTDSVHVLARQIAFPAIREIMFQRTESFWHSLWSLYTGYQKCPEILRDVLFRTLDNSLNKKMENPATIQTVCGKLNKEIHSYLTKNNKQMVSFKRFYPETYRLNAEEVKSMNIEDVLMFFHLGKMASKLYIPEEQHSVFHYSKNVLKGLAIEEYVEYPILKYCEQFLKLVDLHVVRTISNATELDDVTACKILQLFNYRSRFMKLSCESTVTFDPSKNRAYLNERNILELNVICKWLQKHMMGEIFKLSSDRKEADNFYSQVYGMTNQEDQGASKLMKLGKKLKKMYGQPKLFENEEEYNQNVRRSAVYRTISLTGAQPLTKQLNKLTTNYASVTDVSLAFDIPETSKLSLIEEKLTRATVTDKTVSDAMLLPFTSYVIQRVLNLLQTDFHDIISMITEEKQVTIDVTVLTSFVQFCRLCNGFPPAFLNLLEVVLILVQENNNNLRVSSVPLKFWEEFYKTVSSSPASYPLPFLTLDKPIAEGTIEDIVSNSRRLSRNIPLMPYYVQKFTVTEKEGSRHLLAYETVSLENTANYSKQLGTILNVIWKNIAIVDSSAVRKIKLDANFEIKKYDRLISCLISIVTQKLATTENLPKDHIELLNLYFKDSSDYVNSVAKAQTYYKKLQNELKNKEVNKLKVKILTVKLSLMSSILFARVMAEVNRIDQVERYELKRRNIEEDIATCEALLGNYYFQGLVTGTVTSHKEIEMPSNVESHLYSDINLKKVHPHCKILLDLMKETAESAEKYALGNTFRPQEPAYRNLVNDCKHFTKSLLSSKTIHDIYLNLVKTCTTMYEYLENKIDNKTIISNSIRIVKETLSWFYSVDAFYKKLENTYSDAFPDIAKPIQCSLAQIMYSVTSACDLIREMIAKVDQGSILKEVKYLIQYPIEIPKRQHREAYLNRFVSSNFTSLVKRNIMEKDDGYIAEVECLEILKMNLTELKMHCVAKDAIDKPSVDAMLVTLNRLYMTWEKQQRDIEKKKQDDEALYVTKSKCEDEDEEAIAIEEIQEMFPSYSENDFGEFKPPSLEQIPVKKTQKPETSKLKLLISNDDVSLVYKWHSNFVRTMTSAEWLPSKKKLVGNDVISSFLQRYPVFSRVIHNAWEALDADDEGSITPSLMVLITQIKTKIDGNDSNSKVDFYRSPWVSETRQCVPLLHEVKEATNELLGHWPDFPTLKEIIIIINRILSFPVTSAVSRFLTGLELLRDKIEEWNKNSHKGNNMIDMSLAVGQQIINWRKLEMAHWKECLNNLYQRKQSEAHKYWFFIYSVINDHLQAEISDNDAEVAKVTEALKNFMESSNLAEYEVRLDIIYVYHCHLVHFGPSYRRDELISILWNTYNYYAQFSAQVASHIKEKRAPIEKKLRDFVKICSWDRDLSYWSVKDTVDKAHKALHKHTKEFENVLKESVRDCLVDSGSESIEHVGIWDRPKRATASAPAGGAYMIDPTNHIVLARNIKKYIDEAEKPCPNIPEGSLITKVSNLLNKAKILCKDTITNSGYPALVQALDDFVTTVIETSTHLGSLEVDTALPKEKQTSQAKNIVQQKRKALADLFKYLSKMGLNYRTGLVILAATSGEIHDFTIPPVDLDAAMGYLKSRRCDASLSMLWSGCEKYFQKNIARHRLLSAALQSPHQDLGVQNIERCKGFAAQLLQLTNTQKKSISKYSRRLCDLRYLTTNLMNALEVDETESNIPAVQQKFDILTECYANAGIVLEQFNLVLKSCPEKAIGSELEPDFDAVVSDSKIIRCFKNSEEWKDLNKEITTLISDIGKQKNALQKAANTMPQKLGFKQDVPFISQSHIDTVEDSRSDLELIDSDVDRIINEYQIRFKRLITNSEPNHPLLRSIVELSAYLKDTMKEFDKLNDNNDVSLETSRDELIGETEDLIATLLLVVQSVYKKHLPQENENLEVFNAIDDFINNGVKAPEEAKDILEDKHLKELLQDKITSDTRTLQLDTLVSKVRKLLVNYVQYLAVKGKDIQTVKSAMMRLVPILEQAVLFVQYFVTQKVAVHRVSCKMLSVLLKIFSDLATKGFCKPSDLDMEEGDGDGGPGKLSSGTGLGEGDGQKDVSERIENQDQLEDAQRPGEEKKEEERDCKEEEKGVNMTDDFDSHLQDVEKKGLHDARVTPHLASSPPLLCISDGENSDDDDDEDNADKQMGDTDNAAEKLDQQIWGDEDEEPDESEKKEKDDTGPGESTGEKVMAAKEKEQGTDDGSEGKDKKEKKDINEMNEPEVDDDHVDPYHGNQQPLPEPEDFEMPENADVDGEEGDDQDGETESENPFEIDVMKETIPDEVEEEKKKDKDDKIIDLSSDEEDGNEEDGNEEGSKDEGGKEDGSNEEGGEKDKEDEQPDKMDEDQNPEGEEGDIDNNQTEEEKETEESKNEELQQNKEALHEEDKTEETSHEANPQANPSHDAAADDKTENAEMDQGTNDNVETNAEQAKDEDAAPFEQAQEQVGEDKQSTGRSELDKSDKGHRGEKQAASRSDTTQHKQKKHDNKPGMTDQERTLGDINEKKHKQKTLNVEREDENAEDGGGDENQDKDADAFQHVKQAKNDDLQAIDAATKEQAEQQPTIQQEDEDGEDMKEDEQVAMEVDEDDLQMEKLDELKPEKMKEGKEKDKDKSGNKKDGTDEPAGETGIEVEGERVGTDTVTRGRDTTYHTRLEETPHQNEDMSVEQYMSIREWLTTRPLGNVSSNVWRSLWQQSGGAARALCERLRLVLEPTLSSRRAGDFRTGRAINMRRVIPYIASHFRKDRIWLRRTKPAKREYKIAIAVDDSSSMADNRSKELAFESLALVSQALNLLESGELAVLSFGEKPNLLHPFAEQFSEHSGAKILEQLRFEQTKTKIAQLLDFCSVMFEEQAVRSDSPHARLLVIVGDGRNIFAEGESTMIRAVRRARQQGIFLVYVIIDNPENRDSIMDIRKPVMDTVTDKLSFISYLDAFPFPFYLILRDMSALPNVLGDALRQWFELAANTS